MNSRALRIALIVIAALALFVAAVNLFARPAADFAYYQSPRPDVMVIAHQGGDDLWPGNTMFAFENAAALGVDVLEMDLHITADGVLVLMHDETVDRTTDGTGELEQMTLEEVKALDAGYDWTRDDGQTYPFRGQGITVPTLQEVFERFPNYRMVIEIKKPGMPMVTPFCTMIREYNMQDKVLVSSFYDDVITAFRAECPEVATSAARSETTNFVILSKVFLGGLLAPQFQSLAVPSESSGITVMTAQFVRAAHAQNVVVEPWTINDAETMRQYIEWGVDGIITDRPDILLEVLGR